MGFYKWWTDFYQNLRPSFHLNSTGCAGGQAGLRGGGVYDDDAGTTSTSEALPDGGGGIGVHQDSPDPERHGIGLGMRQKDAFEIAFKWILEAEGGKGQIEGDPGGFTSYGISQRFLDSYYPGTKAKDITVDMAKEMYFKHFWPGQRYHTMGNLKTAIMYFDTAVNHGPSVAYRLWTRYRHNLDGWFMSRETIYIGLADKHEWARKILKGWMNRLDKLRQFLDGLEDR